MKELPTVTGAYHAVATAAISHDQHYLAIGRRLVHRVFQFNDAGLVGMDMRGEQS